MGIFDIFRSTVAETDTQKMNKEIFDAVKTAFTESDYIKQDLLPQIIEKIRIELDKGFGFTNVFSYNDCLTLDEKKTLGLPTRKKISREMMSSLSEKGQKLEDPKGTIESLYYKNYSPIKKSYELKEMKRRLSGDSSFLGYKIIAGLDYNTCIVCGAYDGKIIKTVEELDTFENRLCDNDSCGGCEYVPVEKGFGSEMSSGPTYSGWFRKLSAEDKKIILGEYYDRYKNGESIKDIVLSFSKEEVLKHFNNRKESELEEEKKPKAKQPRMKRLTEEELLEFRNLLTKRVSNIWTVENIESMVERVNKMTPKDQHSILESERKRKK